jgi:Flp pilus assembly pilin Flp
MRGHSSSIFPGFLRRTVRRAGKALSFGFPPGATAVEYAVMLLLIAVVILAAVAAVGQTLTGMFTSVLKGFQ